MLAALVSFIFAVLAPLCAPDPQHCPWPFGCNTHTHTHIHTHTLGAALPVESSPRRVRGGSLNLSEWQPPPHPHVPQPWVTCLFPGMRTHCHPAVTVCHTPPEVTEPGQIGSAGTWDQGAQQLVGWLCLCGCTVHGLHMSVTWQRSPALCTLRTRHRVPRGVLGTSPQVGNKSRHWLPLKLQRSGDPASDPG